MAKNRVTFQISLFIWLYFGFMNLQAQVTDSISFDKQQVLFERVKTSFDEKDSLLRNLYTVKLADIDSSSIFIRVFKKEKVLELWAFSQKASKYVFIKKYPVCESSGILGPKRKEGDLQVPEGFYYIDRFNPESRFYLSLGINYPNASDIVLSDKEFPGSDIFIHGDCITIGCIPITDDLIKEVYIAAVKARSAGQENIPVHIFPSKMDDPAFISLMKSIDSKNLHRFWMNLQEGYFYFERYRKVPNIEVDSSGLYHFN